MHVKIGEAVSTFGQRFRALRTGAGLSQTQLAGMAGVSVRAVIYWERDEREPRLTELDAALSTLRATPAERASLVERLTAPRAARLQTPTPASWIGFPPHAGMLLKVLRRRRGATSAVLAAALGISAATLHRWERLELRPAEEQVRLVCEVLDAHPEEQTALLALPWKRGGLPAAPPSLPELRHHVDGFVLDCRSGGAPLIDLAALSLRLGLWPHAVRSDEGRRLMADVNADYGYWLSMQGRNPEARQFADSALEIATPLGKPEGASLIALDTLTNILQGEPTHGSRKAFRLCERWIDAFADSGQRGFLLCFMAEYASRADHHDTALSLIGEVDSFWAGGTPMPDQDRISLDRSRRLQRSRIARRAGRPADALRLLPSASVGTTSQKAFAARLWADTLLAAGEKGDAAAYLGQLQEAISTYGFRFWQSSADALGRLL